MRKNNFHFSFPVSTSDTMGNSSGHQIPKRLKLTYFDVRVRGEPIRMTLAYAALPFEDVRVKPPFDPTSEWKDIKDSEFELTFYRFFEKYFNPL